MMLVIVESRTFPSRSYSFPANYCRWTKRKHSWETSARLNHVWNRMFLFCFCIHCWGCYVSEHTTHNKGGRRQEEREREALRSDPLWWRCNTMAVRESRQNLIANFNHRTYQAWIGPGSGWPRQAFRAHGSSSSTWTAHFTVCMPWRVQTYTFMDWPMEHGILKHACSQPHRARSPVHMVNNDPT